MSVAAGISSLLLFLMVLLNTLLNLHCIGVCAEDCPAWGYLLFIASHFGLPFKGGKKTTGYEVRLCERSS